MSKLAFASDFDNTFYFRDGYHKEDIEAVKEFQRRGNLFGFCSGRSYSGMKLPLNNEIQPDFYIIATGSLILDKDGNPIYRNPIKKDIGKQIYEEISKLYQAAFNTGYDFISFDSNFEVFTKINSWDEVPDDLHGISFLTDSKEKAKYYVDSLPKRYPVSAFQNGKFVDVTGLNSSKGEAIKILKKLYDIETIACMGDNYNDIPMLEEADISFTFPSSPDLVKEKSEQIKSSVSDAIASLL